MRIRTELSLMSVTFVILISIIATLTFYTFGMINKELKKSTYTDRILKGTFELHIVTDEYLTHHEQRMQKQWLMKYESLGRLLESMRKEDLNSRCPFCLETIIKDYEALGALFSQLKNNFNKRRIQIENNKPQAEIDISFALDKHLTNQAIMRTMRITSEAFKLHDLTEQWITRIQQRSKLILIYSTIGVAVFSLLISQLISRAVTRPIKELTKGVERIGSGDLDYRVDIESRGEMGELATAFNLMNENRERAETDIQRWTTVFENAEWGIVVGGSKDQTLELMNPAYARMHGYTVDELTGRKAADLYRPEDRGRLSEFMSIAREKGHHTFEVERTRKDGSTFPSLNTITAIRDADGEMMYYAVNVLDITERKRMEERQRFENERTKLLLELHHRASELSDRELYDYALDRSVELTGSTVGFFHLITDDQKTIILTTWNSEARKSCTADYDTHYPLEKAGNWVECVRQGGPVIYNDFQTSPDQKGLPEGNFPLKRFMSIPVQVGDKVRYIFGVGNKSEDYEQHDILHVQLISNELSRIMMQREAEEAIKESKEQINLLLDSTAEGIYGLDSEGNCTMCNASCLSILGYKSEKDLIGKNMHELIHHTRADGTEYPNVECKIYKALRDGTGMHCSDEVFWCASGLSFDAEYWSYPIKKNGKVIGAVVTFIDITERKLAEESLRKLTHALGERVKELKCQYSISKLDERPGVSLDEIIQGVADNIPPGWHYPDITCARITINEKEYKTANFQETDWKQSSEIYAQGARIGSVTVSYLEQMQELDEGPFLKEERELIDTIAKNLGRTIDRKWAAEEILKLNKELEQRVKERTAQLEAANQELESFAYSVSHDLRAPLRSIDGFSQAIAKQYSDSMDDKAIDLFLRVRAASQRMSELIDNMLELSRLSRAEMSMAEVDLTGLVKEVVEELNKSGHGHDISFHITDGLTVRGDSPLLQAVVENLLGNALKFTSGKDKAMVEFGAMQGIDGKPVFYVRDNGAGFDMTYSDRLFGPFQRLHSVEEFPGTGVGLASVKRIITRHGGKVWAEGQVDKGATFYFTLG